MAKISITHEFDYYEEATEIKSLLKHSELQSLIWQIDQKLRGKLKYGEDDWLTDEVIDYLEECRSLIHSSGALDDY